MSAPEQLRSGLASAFGRWWLEGSELVVSWRRGRLEARDPLAEEWEPRGFWATYLLTREPTTFGGAS